MSNPPDRHLRPVRRVVTANDERGRATIASDEPVPPITTALMPGASFHQVWGFDTIPSVPNSGERPTPTTYFPPLGGVRFGFFSVPPDSVALAADIDFDAAVADFEARLPGMAAHMEPDAPGMHATATVDFEYVVSGEVVLELDDGMQTTLRPGDTVVQNGTRHAWRNQTNEPAVLAVVLIGAPPATATP